MPFLFVLQKKNRQCLLCFGAVEEWERGEKCTRLVCKSSLFTDSGVVCLFFSFSFIFHFSWLFLPPRCLPRYDLAPNIHLNDSTGKMSHLWSTPFFLFFFVVVLFYVLLKHRQCHVISKALYLQMMHFCDSALNIQLKNANLKYRYSEQTHLQMTHY